MLFSLLVANYNNGHFFKDCYKSIIAQTYKNWEVVIVDDGSTDDSVEVIKTIVGDDIRFRMFINKTNRGCGYTKNRCAQLANGEVLGFLDPDDALKKDAIEMMVVSHRDNSNISIITSKYELVDLDMNFMEHGSHGCVIPKGKSYLTYGFGALTHFATFKKKMYLLSENIDCDMKRGVDQDLYFKMEEQGEHLFLNKILYQYRIHKNSISQNENLLKAQYWHFYAVLKASKRRRKRNLSVDNYSRKYISKYASNYYLSRLKKVKHTNKLGSKYYFLFKSIQSNPFS